MGVFVNGDGTEHALVDTIVQATDNQARGVCGILDIGGLAGLLTRAEVMISNDTGPLHLARAVKCPTVGLYWCGNFISAGPVRLAHHQSLLSWTVACPECGTPCVGKVPFTNMCSHEVSFIQDIPVEGVIEAAEVARRRS
jgi:ADP-heptose:LPS heptosyltransferase